MELTIILCFAAAAVLLAIGRWLLRRCGVSCGGGYKKVFPLFWVLSAMSARGQFDTCITFAADTLYQMSPGWRVAHGPEYQSALSYDARVFTVYHNSPNSLLMFNPDIYVSLPYLESDFSQGAYMLFWSRGQCEMVVGTMTRPSDYTTFHPLKTIPYIGTTWNRYVVDLSSAPAGDHYIAFYKLESSSVYLDDIRIMTSGGLIGDFRLANTEDYLWEYSNGEYLAIYRGCDRVLPPVEFTWNAVGNATVHVVVQTPGNIIVQDGYHTGVDTLGVQMNENATYTIFADDDISYTGYCSTSASDMSFNIKVVRAACDNSDCVDTRMLYSNKATPFYGTFPNPYQSVGIVDGDRRTGRHHLCTDTTAFDSVVGPQLRVVPPGDDHSVRLGNERNGAEAEAMLYHINVDTTDFDMLILKYAGVMQDPSHTPEQQPRFRIEVLDSDGRLIQPARCNSYDFVASSDMGWNTIHSGGEIVLWKDWTTVGVDLSGYHGQEVQVRLTTYDCSISAHFGYAYYNLRCAKKHLSFSTCTEGEQNRVEAPEGFNYRWHRANSDSVIATSRIAYLPADGQTYLCDLSFVGDSTCVVTLSAESRLVRPEADFSYTVSREDCRFRVDFSDRSHHEGDTATACDWVMWDFGPLGTSSQPNPVVFFPDSGGYEVTFVAGIAGGDCSDTLRKVLHLEYAFDSIDTSVCVNHYLRWMDSTYAIAGRYVGWINCDSLQVLNLTLRDTALIDTVAVACGGLEYRGASFDCDTVADFVYTNNAGCDSLYRLHLSVHPEYELADTVVVCPGQPFVYEDVDYGGPAAFDTLLSSMHGCDSLVHMALVPRGPSPALQASYSFDGEHWADTLPLKICAPATLHLRDTTPSLQSHLWTLVADTVLSAEGTLEYTWSDDLPAGTDHLATLVATDIYGCTDTLVWPIYVFPSPKADFSWYPFNPSDACPEAEFDNLSSPTDCRWQWTFATAEGTVDTIYDFATVYQWQGSLPSGDFDVTLAASHLYSHPSNLAITHTCTDSATHTVSILPSLLQFPNLVTPNGDGINDRWRIVNLLEYGLYSMNELWIYSRWGDLVYHVRDIHDESQFWDPTDLFCPDGTYFYRFSAKSFCGLIRLNGVIEVVR